MIREKGFGKGHPEAIDLFGRRARPQGRISRASRRCGSRFRKSLTDFQAQVQNWLLAKPPAPADLPDASTVLNSIKTLATDKTKQSELLAEEALDLFRSTPRASRRRATKWLIPSH